MTKILYYNYFIKKGNTKTNASLIPLLEHINSLAPSLGEREKDIYKWKVRKNFIDRNSFPPKKWN